MQQLKVEHKKITSKNQKTEHVEEIDLLEKKVRALISSRRFYRLENSNIFYIESSKPNIVYYCRYTFGSKGNNFCSCKDFEYRGTIRDCYHLTHMIPIGIMKGKIVDVTALPKELKRDNTVSKSFRDDEYDF